MIVYYKLFIRKDFIVIRKITTKPPTYKGKWSGRDVGTGRVMLHVGSVETLPGIM